MQRILASEGYYDAVVDTRIDRGEREEGQERQRRPITAVIDVKPGQRYTLSDIVINAAPTVPPTLIADNFPLAVGEPIVAQRIQGAEAAIALKLPEQGYPFAKVGQRDILLDGATGDGVYTLPVDIGKRSRFGGIETTGDLAFDAEHVEVLARFKRGDLYDSRKVDDLRQALVATGLFLDRRGRTAGDRRERRRRYRICDDAGDPAGRPAADDRRERGLWYRRGHPAGGKLDAPEFPAARRRR